MARTKGSNQQARKKKRRVLRTDTTKASSATADVDGIEAPPRAPPTLGAWDSIAETAKLQCETDPRRFYDRLRGLGWLDFVYLNAVDVFVYTVPAHIVVEMAKYGTLFCKAQDEGHAASKELARLQALSDAPCPQADKFPALSKWLVERGWANSPAGPEASSSSSSSPSPSSSSSPPAPGGTFTWGEEVVRGSVAKLTRQMVRVCIIYISVHLSNISVYIRYCVYMVVYSCIHCVCVRPPRVYIYKFRVMTVYVSVHTEMFRVFFVYLVVRVADGACRVPRRLGFHD